MLSDFRFPRQLSCGMNAAIADGELAGSFVKNGSETAFRSLVARHIDLVFATALRQVGDRGMAEEISQNVFVALARKSPHLAGLQTLAGWLHRTTVLESRARIRAELRRRRREETAAELTVMRQEGASALEALIPLLDEALLNLRESDRLALIYRYFEDRSLREVGDTLGVSEDTARKRVSRAIERVAEFFRERGFAIPGTAGVAGLFVQGTMAAPAALCSMAAQAGIAGGTSVTGIKLLVLNIMALSKTKTALLCAILSTGPLLWQHNAESDLMQKHRALAAELSGQEEILATLFGKNRQERDTLLRVSSERITAESRLAALKRERVPSAPPPRYQWNDHSPVARVPKKLLGQIRPAAMGNRQGELSETIKEILQMRPEEAEQAQAACQDYLARVQAVQQGVIVPVPDERQDRRQFQVGDVSEQVQDIRHQLFSSLESLLGSERFEIFRNGLSSWMPIEDESSGINSGHVVIEGPHQVEFRRPLPGEQHLTWGVKREGSAFTSALEFKDIPPAYAPYLQDWLALARSQPFAEPSVRTATQTVGN
jgi:RNA polymerase sigma factor (sigma-70 family)